MARESLEAKKHRVQKIIDGLKKAYPQAHCELHYSNPLELLIATILSAQAADRQVNLVTLALFQKYPAAADYAQANLAALEQELKSIGLYRSKAKNIKACCRTLLERHRGQVPNRMQELLQLDGVGRKTANVVLGNAFAINEGIVVDTHVARLARRLVLTRQTDPVKIERDLQPLVPRRLWTLFSHWLIWHGRRRCYARYPDCDHCEIQKLCPSAGKWEAAASR